MALSGQLKRLGKHSVIYGLGGLVSRVLAVLLLPLYTHYLSTSDYGQIETRHANSASPFTPNGHTDGLNAPVAPARKELLRSVG